LRNREKKIEDSTIRDRLTQDAANLNHKRSIFRALNTHTRANIAPRWLSTDQTTQCACDFRAISRFDAITIARRSGATAT
jgi:hypothetical protein